MKYVDKYAAGKNRVWKAMGRIVGLVELELRTAYEVLRVERMRTLANQLELICKYEASKGRGWEKVPTYDWVDPYYDGEEELLLGYYSKVRVVELPSDGKKFVLVYGDMDDSKVESGTGPFSTKEEAWMWFLSGGR